MDLWIDLVVEYIAPEVIAAQGHTGAVDWWTLGILIYEMMVRIGKGYLCWEGLLTYREQYATTPFKGEERDDTFNNICNQAVYFPESPKISS